MANKKEEVVQPKEVSTMEEVEQVSEEELKQLDAELKQKSAEENPVASTLATQSKNNLRTLAEIVHDLEKPIHPKFLKNLKMGGKAFTYIPWYIAEKYMSHYANGWEKTVEAVEGPYGATVTVHVTVPTSDFGKVTRGAVGFEPHKTNTGTVNEKMTGFGGASVVAERQATKRSFAAFGLAKYLYEK